MYFIRDLDDDDVSREVLEWEKKFLDKVLFLFLKCYEMFYEVERSIDDVIVENGSVDLIFVLVMFVIMIIFVCLMFGKFFNLLIGYLLFVNLGVFVVVFGILVGIGFGVWCCVMFVNMVGVVFYLVLSIGIDDMFIFVDELD